MSKADRAFTFFKLKFQDIDRNREIKNLTAKSTLNGMVNRCPSKKGRRATQGQALQEFVRYRKKNSLQNQPAIAMVNCGPSKVQLARPLFKQGIKAT
jgi:hypothetical protein